MSCWEKIPGLWMDVTWVVHHGGEQRGASRVSIFWVVLL